MRIIRAEAYGMCFGVRDAVAMARREAAAGPLTLLGELVHNPVVNADLRERGVASGDLEAVGETATRRVMITAHGAADAHRERWQAAGFHVMDATCPLVRRAHEALRGLVERGFFPIVVGRRGHVEVRGLTGDFPEAYVLEGERDIGGVPEAAAYGVIAQTTQPLERVEAIVVELRRARPAAEVVFCDTVCRPTKERQEALRRLCREVPVVVVVGGRSSNNTRELVERARKEGVLAYHVERAEDLQARWFEGVEAAGVTAGTSTLRSTVDEVCRRLEWFAFAQSVGTLEGRARAGSGCGSAGGYPVGGSGRQPVAAGRRGEGFWASLATKRSIRSMAVSIWSMAVEQLHRT